MRFAFQLCSLESPVFSVKLCQLHGLVFVSAIFFQRRQAGKLKYP